MQLLVEAIIAAAEWMHLGQQPFLAMSFLNDLEIVAAALLLAVSCYYHHWLFECGLPC